jgi:hypothetical protein
MDVALRDDLLNYMARNAQDAVALDAPEVVMVAELHARMRNNLGAARTPVMLRVVRELLADQRFRYFGNESFQNAGPARSAIRDYWERAVLPPGFDSAIPWPDNMDSQVIGARVMPHRFRPVLDDLRARPRYVLAIGSRSGDADERDRRIALHFFEEIADRRIARHTPGVLLLGAAHAAATPLFMGQTTTRMILQRRGYRCTSIRVMTDLTVEGRPDDAVLPLTSFANNAVLPEIRLGSLTLRSPISFSTRASPDSPFFSVRDPSSDSGRSLAEQYEFVVLQRV